MKPKLSGGVCAAVAPNATPIGCTVLQRPWFVECAGRWDESLAAYDQVIERDGGATAPALRERVARAIYNRGTALRKMGRESDAIAAWDQDRGWRMMHELEDLRKFFTVTSASGLEQSANSATV